MSGTTVIPAPADQPKCPQCGTPLPTGVLTGLCPACLLKMGAQADTVTGDKQPAFNPPSVAELAPLFPQLEILELIGKGGMGAVYRARQKQLDRIVALKILPPGIGDDPAFAERFSREAKALAKLNHPGIVTLYEFGVAAGILPAVEPGFQPGEKGVGGIERAEKSEIASGTESNPSGRMPPSTSGKMPDATCQAIYFFLMEFVDGVNLRQLLRAGRVSAREALAIVPQICDALQFAHDQGIVHRDIKPENILLDRRGRVKVADFGLAKIVGADAPLTPSLSPSDGERVARLGEGSPVLTDAGKVMGTPQYMSPEQRENPAEVDHRADIYALGVVFYQMLTGELPGKQFQPPSSKVQIDVRLDEVVLRALEKRPELRYQQASALKTQIETIASSPYAAGNSVKSANSIQFGLNYRSKTTLFGLPLVHVASGVDPATGRARVAKGIIAIGGLAKGVIAVGGMAMGGIAMGGGAVGVVAIGGGAFGLISFGGLAIGLLAALGGGAIGLIALGGGAIGYLTFGGGTIGVHAWDAMTRDPVAERFFLPWAKVLMANIQYLNIAVMVPMIFIGVGVPLWLQRRQNAGATPEPPTAVSRNWRKIVTRSVSAGLIVGVLTMAVIATVTFMLPDYFQATARVRLYRLVSPETPTTSQSDFQEIQEQVSLIQTAVILNRVIENLNLNGSWGRKYNRGERLKNSVVLNILRERMGVRPLRNSKLMDIEVFGEDPNETAEIANAIADSYREFHFQRVQAFEAKPPRLVRSGELVVADGPAYYRIDIVERAVPPLRASRPNRPLNLFVGAVLSAILGCIAAIARFAWQFFRSRMENGQGQAKQSENDPTVRANSDTKLPPFAFAIATTFGGTLLLGLLCELLLDHVLGGWLIASFVLLAAVSTVAAFLLGRLGGPEVQRFSRMAGAWLAFLGALPMIGFAAFFVFALLSERGGWNPAGDEAIIVPLIWLGALLLPVAGLRLSKGIGRAVGVVAVAIVVMGSIAVCVWSAWASRLNIERGRANAEARLNSADDVLLNQLRDGKTNNQAFGPVIERTITLGEVGADGLIFVNLEKSEVLPPPFPLTVKPFDSGLFERNTRIEEWIAASGADLALQLNESNWAFQPLGTRLMFNRNKTASETFLQEITPAAAESILTNPKARGDYIASLGGGISEYPVNTDYIFKTRMGTIGLLQLRGFLNDSRGVKIRYKLVQPSEATSFVPPGYQQGQEVSAPPGYQNEKPVPLPPGYGRGQEVPLPPAYRLAQDQSSQTHEPSYRGRALLDWLPEVDYHQPSEKQSRAVEAIQQMGTNVIPYLLADLGDGNPLRLQRARQDLRSADERMRQAAWAFDALGPTARTAIPQLEKLLEMTPGYVPSALAGIGRDALPSLLKALTNDVFWVRDNAAAAIANGIFQGKFSGQDAIAALPIALSNLSYTNATNSLFEANTRARAESLIKAIRSDPALEALESKR